MPSPTGIGRFRRSIIANFAGRAWASLLSLAVVPVYLQLIGVEGYALVGVYASLVTLMNIFDLGLTATMTREMARYSVQSESAQQAANLVRTLEVGYWAVGLIIGGCVTGGSSLVARHWVHPTELSPAVVQQAIGIMGVALTLQWPTKLYAGGLMGLQRQVALNVITGIAAAVRAAGTVVVLIFHSRTVQTFFTCQAAAIGLQTFVIVWCFWRSLPVARQRARVQIGMLVRVWRFAAGISGASLVMIALSQIDKLVLSKVLSLKEFGYYVIAYYAASAIAIPMVPITEALFPRISQLVQKNSVGSISALYHAGCQLVAFVLCPAAALLIAFSELVLWLWTGNAVMASNVGSTFSILVLGAALNALSMSLLDVLLMAFGWLRPFFVARLVALVVGGPLIALFALRFGGRGAAVGWLILAIGYALVAPHWVFSRLLTSEKWYWYVCDTGIPLVTALATAFLARGLIAAPSSRLGGGIYLAVVFAITSGAVALSMPRTRQLFARPIRVVSECYWSHYEQL
jgi:O-antigen/teichoic acid export membrane protein